MNNVKIKFKNKNRRLHRKLFALIWSRKRPKAKEET